MAYAGLRVDIHVSSLAFSQIGATAAGTAAKGGLTTAALAENAGTSSAIGAENITAYTGHDAQNAQALSDPGVTVT